MANERIENSLLIAKGGVQIPASAAAGKVAVSDASGNVSWVDASTLATPAHAASHAITGSDAITPQAIGEILASSRLSDCTTMHWGFVAQGNNPTNNLASGTVYGAIAKCVKAGGFTRLALYTSSAVPSGLTDVRVGVGDSTGAALLSSGNLSGTGFAANTVYALALGATINLTLGQTVYLEVAFLGTTVPTLRGFAGSGLINLSSDIVRTKNANGWAGGALPTITGTNSVNVFPWLALLA